MNRRNSGESPLFKLWQKVFDELAELLGITLAVYDKDEYLQAISRPNPICANFQLDANGCANCDRDCGGMLERVAKAGELISFKCHAHLFNFAAPIRVQGKVEFVLLGGRVFRNYQDFSTFAKKASEYGIRDYFFEDWENSVRFQNAKYFEKATQFIQSMIDSLTSDSARLDQANKREYQMNTLYDLASVLTMEKSLEVTQFTLLQALGVLFDIQAGAFLRKNEAKASFSVYCPFGTAISSRTEINLEESNEIERLREGIPTSLDEVYTLLRLGYPEAVRSACSFPILQKDSLTWVLQIYNTELKEDSVEILRTFCKHLSIIFDNILLNDQIEAGTSLISAVTEFNHAIGAYLEAPQLYRMILEKSAEVLKAEQASLMIYDETSGDLGIKVVKGLNEKIVQNLRIKPGEGIAGFVFETGQPLLIKDIEADLRFEKKQRARYKTKSLMSVPLKVHQRKIGVLNLADKLEGASFDERDLKLLESIAGHAAVALERTGFYRMSEDLRKISVTDSLTDLYNRRFFQDRMNEEIERARRHSHPVSLIMLDIDNFKNYNDTHGHLAGDEALRLTASIIKSSVRNIDLVVRYGGEEFAVILPLTETMAARDIAERIRTGVSGHFFPDDSMRTSVKLSVSLGIASFPNHAGNLAELVGNADKALYLAKVSGKNRVRLFHSAVGDQPN
ncbi:MAG: diguanylate cyclase [Terriglobia bacterium]